MLNTFTRLFSFCVNKSELFTAVLQTVTDSEEHELQHLYVYIHVTNKKQPGDAVVSESMLIGDICVQMRSTGKYHRMYCKKTRLTREQPLKIQRMCLKMKNQDLKC